MFNKALYKQSWKANWTLWTATTLITNFVLIVIMLLLGGQGISNLTSTFSETVVYESLYTKFEDASLNYYTLTEESFYDFDIIFLDELMIEIKNIPLEEISEERIEAAFEVSYLRSLNYLNETILFKINEIDNTITIDDDLYLELSNAIMFGFSNFVEPTYDHYDVKALVEHLTVLDFIEIITTQKDPLNLYDVANSSLRNIYRLDRSQNSSATFLKILMTSEEFINGLLIQFASLGISNETYLSFGFNEDKLVDIANTAILTYRARIDYEISKANADDDLSLIKKTLKLDISANFLSSLPEELTDMLGGIKNQDMYSSTMIGMYYTIVGMLIAIVYIIMVSVNLIAGQVDSGSLAYVLSTGTKRSEITNTQSLFLISSLFFMFLTSTLVSLIVYHFKTPINSEMTYSKLILFGIGTFLVAFAFAGINFLTSAIFNRSRHAMAIGGGITIIMLIFTILGIFGSDIMPDMMRMDVLNSFNYLTIISLVDGKTILNGSSLIYLHFGTLFIIGLICFIASGIIFKKKDLPL